MSKDGEFYCENYLISMNYHDCKFCQGRKRCDLKCMVE